MAKAKQPQPNAPESNAGDDFHLLWAARRVLTLLQPNTDLKGIRLEGPPPNEAAEVDPTCKDLLGIDLAEYFGGTQFEDASMVIHSQLKYSTRRSKDAWTAARLAQGKRTSHGGSVIHRLANVYRGYIKTFGREAVLAKLRIGLVSNRQCDKRLAAALQAAQSALSNHLPPIQSAALFLTIPAAAIKHLKRLEVGASLDSADFCDFLRILDLSHCGAPSRLDQDLALARQIGQFGFPETKQQYAELKTFLHRRMMPESRHTELITADDIAPVLGIPRVEDLFPARPRFEEVRNPVERSQTAVIAEQIVNAGKNIVCLHGGAGCGKTTLVQSMRRHLPAGSAVVVFDCYGGGSYLDRAEVRHGYRRAIMEVANELASQTGVHLLLGRDLPVEDLLREFTRRLRLASLILKGEHPDALVAVVIDAADNSLVGAAALNEESFVAGLAKCEMPEGCRLVLTARTHRVKNLQLPRDSVLCEILSFSPEETRANLNRYSIKASEAQAEELHHLSNGIPRVQGYALSGPVKEIEEALSRLRPDGRTLEGIIDHQLAEAGKRLGIADFAEQVCPVTLTLPRPIPLEYVALLAKQDVGAVRDFCFDMQPGMTLEAGLLSFRDEDFESRLRQRFAPSTQHAQQLAELMLERSRSDRYAAAHLADALKGAGRVKELISLVYDQRQPAAIADPVERTEVFAKRAQLALEAVQAENDATELLKLMFVVAEASKTDQAVEDLLLKNADLACRYGDPLTVQRLYLNQSNKRVTWYGPTHLLCAANFSRNPDTHGHAREHLRSAEAWLRHWSSTPKEERQRWSIENEHIALGAEAILRLEGCADAISWFAMWRPPSVVTDAAARLARSLAMLEGQEAFSLLDNTHIRADGLLLIIDAAMEAGLCPPKPLVDRAARVWCRFASGGKRPDPTLVRPGISLCEAAALCRIDHSVLLSIMKLFVPQAPEHCMSIYSKDTSDSYDTFLRGCALLSAINGKALDGNEAVLLPQRLRDELNPKDYAAKRHREEEQKEFFGLYGFLVPAYALRAQFIVGTLAPENLGDRISVALGSGGWEWSSRSRRHETGARKLKAMVLADAAVRACPEDKNLYNRISEHFCKDGWLDGALALAEKAIQAQSLHGESLRLLDQVAQQVAADPPPASELVNTLITCSRVAGRADTELGRHYFEKAVTAASEVDEEAFTLLQLLAALAERAVADEPTAHEPNLAKDFAKVIEDCRLRLEGWDHFPWSECITGLTKLSPAVAATALGRWDQQGFSQFTDNVPGFVAACLDIRRLPASVVVASNVLAPLGSYGAMQTSLSGISAMKPSRPETGSQCDKAISLLCDHAIRLAPLADRRTQADLLLKWADENGIADHPTVAELRSFVEFTAALSESKDYPAPHRAIAPTVQDSLSEKPPESPDWSAISTSARYIEPAEIEAAFREIATLTENGDYPWPHRVSLPGELLTRIANNVVPGDYCRHLDALVAVDPGLIRFDDLIRALQHRLRHWSHHPLVRDWQTTLPALLAKYRFHDFFWMDFFSFKTLDDLEESLGVSKTRMCDELIRALPQHIRDVTAKAVHCLAWSRISSLPGGSSIKVLKWALPMFASRVKRNTLICQDIDVSNIPLSGHDLTATVLWFLFGHPDKRVRWKAVHAARRIVQLGEPEILQCLSKWLDAGRSHPFVMPGTMFYWLAARQWFFVLVDRLSAELPESVLPLAQKIASEATTPDMPHALIMRFARRAALRLARHRERPYTVRQVRAITSSLKTLKRRHGAQKAAQHHERNDCPDDSGERFRFDSLDTLPYWYSRVQEVFGLSGAEFCKAAERWICDEWGIAGDVWASDPIRKWDNWDREWTLRSHSHGSEPTIEDLHTYLEFNAMFCVAGEMVATRPVVGHRWEMTPWEDWLSRWDLPWQQEWLADRRQRTPMEGNLWQWAASHRDDWAKNPENEAFDRAVGLNNPLHPGYLIAEARLHRYQYGDYESIDVSSALVSADTAQALLYALAESRHPFDYRIPLEGDELEIEEVLVDGTRFCLKGWIHAFDGDSEGIDQHDPLRYGLGKELFVPGSAVKKAASLKLDKDRRMSFRKGCPSAPVTVFEHWNDCARSELEGGFQTEGHRLWVHHDLIQSFLRSGGWNLIVRCIINRRLKRHESGNSEDKYDPQAKLYLIHSDGTIEAVKGRFVSGTAAGPGAEAE